MSRRGARCGLCLAVLVMVLAAASPAPAAAARRRLHRAADAKELTDRLRTAGARKVAVMLNPDARLMGPTTAADFSAVRRDPARERLSRSELTDGVRHDALRAAAALQTKAKIGVDAFARGEALAREQEAALAAAQAPGAAAMMGPRRAAALGAGGGSRPAWGSLAPESGAAARPADLTIGGGGGGGGGGGAAPAPPPAGGAATVASAAREAQLGSRGAKSTAATRAIFGFNDLASGLPSFLSRALAGRTTVTSA